MSAGKGTPGGSGKGGALPGDTDLPEPRIDAPRRGGISAAWLIPLVALAIAATMAWRHYSALGPEIRILLQSGSGIEPGRTTIRYRDVEVGVIKRLSFTSDLSAVVATAQMDAEIADQLTDSARFWVVRPQISAAGIAGLETVLSGIYVGVDWGETPGRPTDTFEVLSSPPQTAAGTPGRRFRLFATDGASAAAGSPVFFKSIEVGRVETKTLSEDFAVIEYEIFVNAPHDQRVTTATRFWDASGLDIELGAEGVRIAAPSLVSILRGGIAFDTLGPPPGPDGSVEEGRAYELYASARAAEDSLFENPGEELRLTIAFAESVRGLSEGAPVEYRGLQIGSVEDVELRIGESLSEAEIVTTVVLQPRRFGFYERDQDAVLAFFRRSVERGLRARLAVGSFVTGATYVQFVELPAARAAELDLDAMPYPRLPSVPSQLGVLQGSVEEILTRIERLPVEELLANASGFLSNLQKLTEGEEVQGITADLAETIASARRFVTALEAAETGEAITDTLADVRSAASSFETGAAALPELARRMTQLAARAEEAVGSLADGGALNRAALAAVRDVQNAARAIRSLADTIERDPNSLILGR